MNEIRDFLRDPAWRPRPPVAKALVTKSPEEREAEIKAEIFRRYKLPPPTPKAPALPERAPVEVVVPKHRPEPHSPPPLPEIEPVAAKTEIDRPKAERTKTSPEASSSSRPTSEPPAPAVSTKGAASPHVSPDVGPVGGEEPIIAYDFPMVSTISESSTDELVRLLSTLCAGDRPTDLYSDEAERFRHRYCSVSIRLNELQTVAPRFRTRLGTDRMDRSPFDNAISNDLTVIDLHWLHCQSPVRMVQHGVPNPFAPEFDWRQASEFASLRWRAEAKVRALNLDVYEQWQLAQLQTPEQRKLARKWFEQTERLRQTIRSRSLRDGRLRDDRVIGDWPELLLARTIAAHADGLIEASENVGVQVDVKASKVRRVFRWISGKDLARQNVDTRVKRAMEFVASLPTGWHTHKRMAS